MPGGRDAHGDLAAAAPGPAPPRSFGASGPRESAPRLGDAPFRADSPLVLALASGEAAERADAARRVRELAARGGVTCAALARSGAAASLATLVRADDDHPSRRLGGDDDGAAVVSRAAAAAAEALAHAAAAADPRGREELCAVPSVLDALLARVVAGPSGPFDEDASPSLDDAFAAAADALGRLAKSPAARSALAARLDAVDALVAALAPGRRSRGAAEAAAEALRATVGGDREARDARADDDEHSRSRAGSDVHAHAKEAVAVVAHLALNHLPALAAPLAPSKDDPSEGSKVLRGRLVAVVCVLARLSASHAAAIARCAPLLEALVAIAGAEADAFGSEDDRSSEYDESPDDDDESTASPGASPRRGAIAALWFIARSPGSSATSASANRRRVVAVPGALKALWSAATEAHAATARRAAAALAALAEEPACAAETIRAAGRRTSGEDDARSNDASENASGGEDDASDDASDDGSDASGFRSLRALVRIASGGDRKWSRALAAPTISLVRSALRLEASRSAEAANGGGGDDAEGTRARSRPFRDWLASDDGVRAWALRLAAAGSPSLGSEKAAEAVAELSEVGAFARRVLEAEEDIKEFPPERKDEGSADGSAGRSSEKAALGDGLAATLRSFLRGTRLSLADDPSARGNPSTQIFGAAGGFAGSTFDRDSDVPLGSSGASSGGNSGARAPVPLPHHRATRSLGSLRDEMDEKRDEKGPPRGLANPDRLGSEREEKERVVAAFPFVSPRGSGASSALGYPGAPFFKPPPVSRLVEAERVAARVAGSALSAILAAADVEDLSSGRAPSFSVGDALASFAISLACSDDAETHAAIAPAIEALLVATARDLGGGSFSFSEPGSSTEPDRTEPMVDRVSATRPRDEKASLAARSLTDPGGGAFLGAASLVASRSMRASRSVSHRLASLASASRPFARLAGSDSQLTNGLVRAVRRFAEPPGWEEEAARRRALFLRGHARLSGRVESVGGSEFGGAAIVGGGEHLHERDERDADREAGWTSRARRRGPCPCPPSPTTTTIPGTARIPAPSRTVSRRV